MLKPKCDLKKFNHKKLDPIKFEPDFFQLKKIEPQGPEERVPV